MNFLDWDLEILKFINQPFIPTFNLVLIFIIFSVYGYLVFLLFYFFRTKQKDKLFRLLIITVFGMLFVNAIKFSVKRPRPSALIEGVNPILIKSDPSFPSSHTFIAIMCAFFPPKTLPRVIRLIINFYLVFLIPVSLIYIGVHFPSDILVAAFIAFLFVKFFNEKRTESIKNQLSLKF